MKTLHRKVRKIYLLQQKKGKLVEVDKMIKHNARKLYQQQLIDNMVVSLKRMKKRSLEKWTKYIHRWAKRKGWWEFPNSPLEIHMKIVTEAAEATEEVRSGNPDVWFDEKTMKPEGEAIELADAVIRIMDYFGYKKWDLEKMIALKMRFNETRPYRHGGKKC